MVSSTITAVLGNACASEIRKKDSEKSGIGLATKNLLLAYGLFAVSDVENSEWSTHLIRRTDCNLLFCTKGNVFFTANL